MTMLPKRTLVSPESAAPIAPSQGDAAQRSLGGVAEADPAIVEEAVNFGPAPKHLIHGLQDLEGARGASRSLSSQAFMSSNSGLLFFWRTARRSSALRPLTARSISNNASRRLIASSAIGRPVCPCCLPGRSSRCRPARRSPAAHARSRMPA